MNPTSLPLRQRGQYSTEHVEDKRLLLRITKPVVVQIPLTEIDLFVLRYAIHVRVHHCTRLQCIFGDLEVTGMVLLVYLSLPTSDAATVFRKTPKNLQMSGLTGVWSLYVYQCDL